MSVLIVASSPDADVLGALRCLPHGTTHVIAADGGADHCVASGVTPDLLIGDLDSIDEQTLAVVRAADVEVLSHPADKEETDLDLALAELRRRDWDGPLVLTGVLGGRLDHTLATLGSLSRAADLSPEVFERDVHVWLLTPGGRSTIRVAEVGATVTVMATTQSTVSGDGLRWPLSHTRLRPLDSLGLSNVVESPAAELRCEDGTRSRHACSAARILNTSAPNAET